MKTFSVLIPILLERIEQHVFLFKYYACVHTPHISSYLPIPISPISSAAYYVM